jgi:pantoate--beta-alanine ligase
MVADLNVDVRIVGVPIVREDGGLAMSSRNRYLDAEQREQAGALSAALLAAGHAAAAGADAALAAARAVLDEVPEIDIDYLQVRGPNLESAPASGPARILVAARVGTTRLLDNCAIELPVAGALTGPVAGPDSPRESRWRN